MAEKGLSNGTAEVIEQVYNRKNNKIAERSEFKVYKNKISKLRETFTQAYEEGEMLKAILTGERILKIYEENNGVQTLYFADDAYNLACAYSKEYNFSKAVELYKKAAETVGKIEGKNLKLSNILNNMAIDFNLMGNHDKAVEYFKKTFKIREEILEQNNVEFIDSLFNLGSAYFDAQDFDNAIKYHKAALSYREKKDLDYADNLNMIGYSYEEKNDLENASEYFSSALDIIKKTKGLRSQEYLKNIYYLGSIYEKDKNFIEAKNCYEKSVELIKSYIGDHHPYYAEALNKLANSYLKCGNENKALTLRMKALNIIKNIVGENHLYYASSLKNIADIYFKKEDYKRAEKMYSQALNIKENILGSENEEYIKDAASLCKTYIQEEEYTFAESLLKKLLKNSKSNKDLYVTLLLDLAYIYAKTYNTSELYSVYEEFANLEPGLSFDEMLNDIKEFEKNIEYYLSEEELTKDDDL